jgi:hypothetical protein
MKNYIRSKSSLFLMEIILNILLFAVLLSISLQMILKAHTLTADTTLLHRAVTICSNVAGCFENGDGTLASIREVYPLGNGTDTHLAIYFDDSFAECSKAAAVYVVSVGYVKDSGAADNSHLTEISISFGMDSQTIYSVRACHYEPLSARSRIGGV